MAYQPISQKTTTRYVPISQRESGYIPLSQKKEEEQQKPTPSFTTRPYYSISEILATPTTRPKPGSGVVWNFIKESPAAISSTISEDMKEDTRIRQSQTLGQNFKRDFFEKPVSMYKFVAQGIIGSVLGLGRSVQEAVATPIVGKEKAREITQPKEVLGVNLDQYLAGQERVKSYQEIKDDIKKYVDETDVATEWEKEYLPGTLAFGLFALDAWPGKPNVKKPVAKVIADIAKETSEKKIIKELLEAGIEKNIVKNIAPKLVKETEEEGVRQIIKEEAGDLFQEVVERAAKQTTVTSQLDDLMPQAKGKTLDEFLDSQVAKSVKSKQEKQFEFYLNDIEKLDQKYGDLPEFKKYGTDDRKLARLADSYFDELEPETQRWLEFEAPGIDFESIDTPQYKGFRNADPESSGIENVHGGQITLLRENLDFARQNSLSELEDIWKKANAPVVAQQSAARKPTLPPLSPEMAQAIKSKRADDTIQQAVLQRYRDASNRPSAANEALAKAAKAPANKEGVKKLMGEILTPISSRLGRINPKLKTRLRQFEYKVATQTTEDANKILPLLEASKKMTPQDRLLFDLARKNGDSVVVEALAAKYGIEDALKQARQVLDDIYARAKDVGMEVEYRGDYFPRVVINPEKFMAYLRGREDWGYIQRLINQAATKKGIKPSDLTSEEQIAIVNNFIRGYGDKITLSKPGFTQGRKLAVIDDELNQFYASTDEALSTYVIRMNDEIEGRRFFGKKEYGDTNMNDSIGRWVLEKIANGEIQPDKEKEITDILKSRFHRGKMNSALDVYRNAEYMSTMGSPISAITQIGDIAFSAYNNGLYHTAKGIGKSLFSKNKVTKEMLGIENITQEFTRNTISGKALDNVFKLTGLEKMDRLGKETLVNGYLSKLQRQALTNDDRLMRELDELFDTDEVLMAKEELARGEITERTKLIAFNKLLDFQPVAKSEMPQKYLEMPNGRIFYMLKSFTLKQIDVFRREAIDDIVSGDVKLVAKGMKNLLLLSGAFMAANATADEMKDLVLGRETSMTDRLIDNLWRLVGASKYDVYKARTEGVGKTIQTKILFPTSIYDNLTKDIVNISTGKEYEKGEMEGEPFKLETIQSLPVGGKLYYWWFGRGAQKEEYKEGASETMPSLPTLPTLPQLPTLPTLPG